MDLSTFLDRFKKGTYLSGKQGLYCVKQSNQLPSFQRIFKCGKSTDLVERMRQYRDMYASGGKVYFILTVPKRSGPRFTETGVKIKDYLTEREKIMFTSLVAQGGVRTRKTEHVSAELPMIRKAMEAAYSNILGFNLYKFEQDRVFEINPTQSRAAPPMMPPVRQSPRFASFSMPSLYKIISTKKEREDRRRTEDFALAMRIAYREKYPEGDPYE